MNESVFKEILGEALKCGLAEFDNAPEHKFSLKHRLAMKRILAKFARNVRKLNSEEKAEYAVTVEYKPRLNIRQRILFITIVIILMTFLVGWVVMFVSEKFHGTVYSDNTQLIAIEFEGSPTTIEYKYALASIPDGFEMIDTNSSPKNAYTRYKNKQTGQGITIRQWVKEKFEPHYNTENHHFEEVTVNGKVGLYIDFSEKTFSQTLLVWDNEDYILEIVADLTKAETMDLAKFNKK